MAWLRAAGAPVLPLGGAPVVPLPAHVAAAAVRALADRVGRIPSRGLPRLREAIADTLSREWGTKVDPEQQLLITNGAMQGLDICFRSLLKPGDHVVIPSPAFFFSGLLKAAGLETTYAPGLEERSWAWDLDRIRKSIRPSTRALVVCSPANPTGFVPGEDEVREIVRIAEGAGLLLIADESYERFLFDRSWLPSFGRHQERWPKTVIVRSMSKSYALSDWRIGFVQAEADLIDRCLRLFEWSCLRCGHVGQVVAAEAVLGPQDWMRDCIADYRTKRDLAYATLKPPLSSTRPAGAAFLFVKLGEPSSNSSRIQEELLGLGVPLVPGHHFQAPGYARLPFGGPDSALASLKEILLEWSAHRAPGLAPA